MGAQVFSQNQVILPPFGSNGFVVSTSTSFGAKLQATSTPYFANFFAANGNITNLTVGNCTGCGSSTFGTSSLSAIWPIIYTQSASLARFSFGGLGTSTPAVQGNIPYFSGVNTFANVATTTASCSGTTSCSAFTVIGNSPITISSSGSTVVIPVSTSTNETAGFLAYWTSTNGTPALLGKVATSTLTASSPLTGNFTQVGTGGALGCQTASGSQAGCLSTTDWNTFNNKENTLTFNYPLTRTTNTIGFSGLATATPWTGSGVAYRVNNNTVSTVATTTLTGTGIVSISNSPVLIGASGAVASITGGTNGQVLGWLNDIPTWTASSSVIAGTNITITTVGAATTVNCASCITSVPPFPFTPASNFGALANATGTPIWFQAGLQSSSTIQSTGFNVDRYGAYQQAGTNILYASSTTGTLMVGRAATTGWYNSTSTAGTNSVAIGNQALNALPTNSLVVGNTAVGNTAAANNSAGFENTAIGNGALNSNRTGQNNTAIGWAASQNNRAATNTVAVGALSGGTNGTFTAKGYTVLGYAAGALFDNGADYNTLIGYNSGGEITTGANNILIGADSSASVTNDNLISGSNNIKIGYNNSFPSATANNQLNIANLIFGANVDGAAKTYSTGQLGIGSTSPMGRFTIQANNGDTNRVLFAIGSSTASATSTLFSVSNIGTTTLGNFGVCNTTNALTTDSSGNITCGVLSVGSPSTDKWASTTLPDVFGIYPNSATRVGIGTTTPFQNYLLQVATSTGQNLVLSNGSTATQWAWRVLNDGTLNLSTSTPSTGATSSTPLVKVQSTSATALGVATTSPWRTLAVTGTVGFDGLTSALGTVQGLCLVTATKEVVVNSLASCVTSSRRFKTDINYNAIEGLDTLMRFQPVTFTRKDSGLKEMGFIAEDVAAIDTRLAGYDQSGLPSSIDTTGILAITVQAVKQVATTNDVQDKEIAELKEQIAELKKLTNECHI